jgi:hypothetical protein
LNFDMTAPNLDILEDHQHFDLVAVIAKHPSIEAITYPPARASSFRLHIFMAEF